MPKQASGRRKRKSGFKVEWVKLPSRWIERLQAAHVGAATFQLAHVILVESFKLGQMAVKEIVLSKQVTGLSRGAQRRAVGNLVRLALIKVKREAGKAVRVTELYV